MMIIFVDNCSVVQQDSILVGVGVTRGDSVTYMYVGIASCESLCTRLWEEVIFYLILQIRVSIIFPMPEAQA